MKFTKGKDSSTGIVTTERGSLQFRSKGNGVLAVLYFLIYEEVSTLGKAYKTIIEILRSDLPSREPQTVENLSRPAIRRVI